MTGLSHSPNTHACTPMHAATMTEEVKKLASVSLQRPVRLAADAAASAPKQLTQEVLRLKGAEVSLVC